MGAKIDQTFPGFIRIKNEDKEIYYIEQPP